MSESRSSRFTRSSDKVRLGPRAHTSMVRTGIAALLVLVGIAWLVVYLDVAGPNTDGTKLTWMGDLGRWNYLIGFGLIFVGLAVRRAPLDPARPRPRRGGRDARLLPDRAGLDRRLLRHRPGHHGAADHRPRRSTTWWSASASWPSASSTPPTGSSTAPTHGTGVAQRPWHRFCTCGQLWTNYIPGISSTGFIPSVDDRRCGPADMPTVRAGIPGGCRPHAGPPTGRSGPGRLRRAGRPAPTVATSDQHARPRRCRRPATRARCSRGA